MSPVYAASIAAVHPTRCADAESPMILGPGRTTGRWSEFPERMWSECSEPATMTRPLAQEDFGVPEEGARNGRFPRFTLEHCVGHADHETLIGSALRRSAALSPSHLHANRSN